jgi:hypothetical protein
MKLAELHKHANGGLNEWLVEEGTAFESWRPDYEECHLRVAFLRWGCGEVSALPIDESRRRPLFLHDTICTEW